MPTSENHPPMDKLRLYCEGSLPDFQQSAVEEHLIDCDECVSSIQRMDALLFSGFTARAHAASLAAEARLADPLVAALQRSLESSREFASTIQRWLDSASSRWGDLTVPRWGEAGLLPTNGGSMEPLIVSFDAGVTRAEAIVREERRTIEVRVQGAAPVALLFDDNSVRIEPFRNGVARFEDVPEGRYYLAIAPE